MLDIDRQTTFDGLVEVFEKFLESFPLCGAAGDRGDLGPVPAFLRFVDDDFDLHSFSTYRLAPRQIIPDSPRSCLKTKTGRRGQSASRGTARARPPLQFYPYFLFEVGICDRMMALSPMFMRL